MVDSLIIEQYRRTGIPTTTLLSLNKLLALPGARLSPLARPQRLAALSEALGWEKGPDQEHRKVTTLYTTGDYTLAVAKPGKEAAPDYKGCRHYKTNIKTNNPNDMHLLILKKGKTIGEAWTFGDMFENVEHLMHADLFGLELMGTLLFRAAFMLDHKRNKDGNWRYVPSEEVVQLLEHRIPSVAGVPTRVFLHFLEILSLNEDVKVHTLGYEGLKHDYGRINTLLTFVHLVAVLLERKSLAKFAGTFARPPVGMAPIPKTKAWESFPLLRLDLTRGDLEGI